MIYHYILTRFNLALWRENKTGQTIDREEWLVKRIKLFETYCLPSVVGQTCQNFSWILLVDEIMPKVYREKITAYCSLCPQIRLVSVKRKYAFRFADIFRQVVMADLETKGYNEGDLCLTTYLDNDDCINKIFVEKVRAECLNFHLRSNEKRFLSFDYGLQLFTDMNHLATRILYPNNHFLTLAENLSSCGSFSSCSLSSIRTCYGYGSHFLLEKRGLAEVHHIRDKSRPMWVEVIHEGNVNNDVKMTFHTDFVNDKELLRREYSLQMDVGMKCRMAFVCRVVVQVWRRLRNKITNK